MSLFRRKSDRNPVPPLPEMECPIKIQQLVLLGRNICFRTEEIQKSGMHEEWHIKGTAFYRIPKNSTDILIERSIDPGIGSRPVYTVSYNRYGATYKEIVLMYWTASGLDEHTRRYLLRYEILNVIPDFK